MPRIVTQNWTYYFWIHNARVSLSQGDVEIQLLKIHQKFKKFVGDRNAKAIEKIDALEIRGWFIVSVMEINLAWCWNACRKIW